MYKVLTIENSKEWKDIINSFKQTDVYFYPGYLKTFFNNGDGEPTLFYFENQYGKAANVFLKRDIYYNEKLKPYIQQGQYFDITSVYGYGGPIFESVDFDKLSICYLEEFESYCKDINVIAEFIRFHPVLKNHILPEKSYDIQNIRSTICIDLSHGEKQVWDSLESNCKRNIKKALSHNVHIIYGRDESLVNEFVDLYIQTMHRDNASSYYFFNKMFFDATMLELPNNSLIFAAVYNEKIIAASIIIFSEKLVHYHLGGSNADYQSLRANNLLIYEVAKWGCKKGKTALHLGGGFSGDQDTLYRFKRSFSKATPLPFYIGKKIYDQYSYKKLIDLRTSNDHEFDVNTNYFPKYRG